MIKKYQWWGLCCAFALVACGGSSSEPGVEVGEADPVAAQSEADDLTKNALTQKQQKTTLKLVDDICGDSWCEGDYNFGFRLISCAKSAHTCTLTLQIFPREGAPGSEKKSYWRSCKTSGFTSFASLVTTASNGYQSLNDDYYDALTECVQRIEANLR